MPDDTSIDLHGTAFDARVIDVRLVARLVAEQFPQWADLPVRPVPVQGNDNRSFRLGDDLLVRLPSAPGYAPQVAKEQRWLPYLQPRLPVPVPIPVAAGSPGAGYPFRWSVLQWLDGDVALRSLPSAPHALTMDLARFLGSLHQVDATGGPAAGQHSFHRGEHPSVYDADVQRCLRELHRTVGKDVHRLMRMWEAALDSRWEGSPVWFHGDFAAGNILINRDARLVGVIDFGCCGVGDPACDLALAWTMLDAPARDAFRRAVGPDDGTWERGRAWALWKSAITFVDGPDSNRRKALEALHALAGP